jgi:hypothetical protein
MSLTATTVGRYLSENRLLARHGVLAVAIFGLLHLTALGLMLWFEVGIYAMLIFLLTWGLLNFFWLVVLRRAVLAAALSLLLVVTLITFSEPSPNSNSACSGFRSVSLI